jgi:diaminopimelate epimerase
MHFAKLQALGNDFIVIASEDASESALATLSRELCDRHFGVGADGLLLCRRTSTGGMPNFHMRVFNADGGEAELSGNGLRCLAAYVCRQGWMEGNELTIDTLGGRKTLRLVRTAGTEYWFEVDMGKPILDPAQIAFRPRTHPLSLIGYLLVIDGKAYPVTVTSMGNPHCSLFLDTFEDFDWERLGRQIETHAYFPQRTNVEFIQVTDDSSATVRFWERGVGKTFSSGTGSCAALVACVLGGFTGRDLRITTLGGDMELSWLSDQSIRLKGPAKFICEGEYAP